jgi:hypothetical protein
MRFAIVLTCLSILSNSIVNGADMTEVPGKTVTLESLVEMFDNIESKTPWNMSGDMLWGYFFTHKNPQKLEQIATELNNRGYKFVDIYLSDKEEPTEPDLYWLHVEKIEKHTPQTLDKRNDELYIFAYEMGVDSYDGMDVGPVPQ